MNVWTIDQKTGNNKMLDKIKEILNAPKAFGKLCDELTGKSMETVEIVKSNGVALNRVKTRKGSTPQSSCKELPDF